MRKHANKGSSVALKSKTDATKSLNRGIIGPTKGLLSSKIRNRLAGASRLSYKQGYVDSHLLPMSAI